MKKLICMLCLFLNINVINTNQIDAACLHAIIVGDAINQKMVDCALFRISRIA